mgnify:CR=1 FL=1
MLLDRLTVPTSDFHHATGWEAKPEGMCKGDVCVPVPGAIHADRTLDVAAVADRLGMALEEDAATRRAAGTTQTTHRKSL